MSSSLTTCSSTAEDEFSSDVFGEGGNAEVNDGGTTTSVSDGNSRKTIIGDGGMKRKMTELFILTVVNITVTVALINFITPNENGRINSELESLKKFVEKMEQQHVNNDGQQTGFCAKMDTDKDMVKAIETKLNELVEQQKKEAIFIGVLKDRFGKDGQQTEFYAKMNTVKDMNSKWPSFQQLIELSFCILLDFIKLILCIILLPLLADILRYDGDKDFRHLILNIVLNLYLTNILGAILGYVPGIIHALWYCFFS
ncbi:hypothetical protein niasHT_014631 [Heterodera trifolii]|uniref:Uncharacterized protein n=1 Tax=Heterodera trifolii TaxID=157864 RepID=A0ABD2LHV5_9BILA